MHESHQRAADAGSEGMKHNLKEGFEKLGNEITPEMTQAGKLALAFHDDYFDGDAEGVCKIYNAMEAARVGVHLSPDDFDP